MTSLNFKGSTNEEIKGISILMDLKKD